MMKFKFIFLCLFWVFTTPTLSAWATENPFALHLEVYTTQNQDPPAIAVLTLTPKEGWHSYGNIQGPSGFPTTIQGNLNEQSLRAFYPQPTPGPDPMDPTLMVDLYMGTTSFFLTIPSQEAKDLQVTFEALLCSNTACWPVHEKLSLRLPALDSLATAESQPWYKDFLQAQSYSDLHVDTRDHAGLSSKDSNPPKRNFQPHYFSPGLEVKTFSKAAGLAFLAGLILNFMPCVLPVITLKLRSFIPTVNQITAHQRQAFTMHNIWFALGMMIYFLILAIIISATGMVWGQIFQKPEAIVALTAIVFALSLSLFGIYDLPLIDLKAKVQTTKHHPRLESFTTGMLATILATPCSGPFLGGVLAWALIQPPEIIALILSCVGLGMASPYLVMAMFPDMYKFLPTPGAWTIHLEHFLGFLLAGTCVYLMSLLPVSLYVKMLILLWIIALGAWIWGKGTNLSQSRKKRWAIRSNVLAAIVLSVLLLFRSGQETNPWTPFDWTHFENQLGQEHMIVEFTADWCPNCKFLEKTVLTPKRSAELAKKYDAKLYQVDLTRHDPSLMALLESLGSKSIPILAIFSKENPETPLVLRDLFTSGQLHTALEKELN